MVVDGAFCKDGNSLVNCIAFHFIKNSPAKIQHPPEYEWDTNFYHPFAKKTFSGSFLSGLSNSNPLTIRKRGTPCIENENNRFATHHSDCEIDEKFFMGSAEVCVSTTMMMAKTRMKSTRKRRSVSSSTGCDVDREMDFTLS